MYNLFFYPLLQRPENGIRQFLKANKANECQKTYRIGRVSLLFVKICVKYFFIFLKYVHIQMKHA